MNQTQEYLTQEKFDQFKAELEVLKTVKRKEIAEALEYAKSLGDLSENGEYHEARDNQARVEDRINHLEALLRSVTIVSKHDNSKVTVGSKVTLSREGSKENKIYTIVGSEETDAASGKISNKSPLGEAMFGKVKGDSFSYKTPTGSMTYKIVSIE